MSTAHDRDLRDAHLQAALRHAPDADAQPPRALDDAVLNMARGASRASPPGKRVDAAPSLLDRAQAWWQKPTAVPALAALALSTVLVTLWRHEPVPVAVPEREVSPDATQVAGATLAPAKTPALEAAASAAPGAVAPTPASLPTPQTTRPAVAAPGPSPAVVDTPGRAPESGRVHASESARPPETFKSREAKPGSGPANSSARSRAPEATPAPARADVQTSERPVAESAEATSDGRRARAADSADVGAQTAPAAPAAPQPTMAASTAKVAGGAMGRSGATTQVASRDEGVSDLPPPLARLLRPGAEPSWSVRRAGTEAPVRATERELAWLSSIASATRDRWRTDFQVQAQLQTLDAVDIHDADQLVARIIVGTRDVRVVAPNGNAWVANVGEQTAQALRQP